MCGNISLKKCATFIEVFFNMKNQLKAAWHLYFSLTVKETAVTLSH